MRFTFWTVICSLLLLGLIIEDSPPIYSILIMCFIISCLQINAFSKAVESDKEYRGFTKGELNKKYKYQIIFWGISFFGLLIYGFISLIIILY